MKLGAMTLRRGLLVLWPRNLAGRTVLVLLVSLTVFHLGSLWMHQHGVRNAIVELDEPSIAALLVSAARSITPLPESERDHAAHALSDESLNLSWSARPSVEVTEGQTRGAELRARLIEADPAFTDSRFVSWGNAGAGLRGSVALGDGTWLNVALVPVALSSGTMGGLDAVASTTIMAVGIVAASVLLVRWLTGPLRRLAQAADGIGRGRMIAVPQDGPEEVQSLARALDAMQARITRLVDDRTLALAAVSHDLRTPITRMRLRAGFLEDRDTQLRMEADLDEMEGMIAATLAYLQGEAETEPPQLADIGALLSTLCDAAADTGAAVSFRGPAHLDVRCRLIALRRAVSNLIGNAVSYGGEARVRLKARPGEVVITVDDSGPGIPATELERVFEPFHRLEGSRNRSTGGVGVGLTIARQAIQEQGGTLTLSNPAQGGLRAVISLPDIVQRNAVRIPSSPAPSGIERQETPYVPT